MKANIPATVVVQPPPDVHHFDVYVENFSSQLVSTPQAEHSVFHTRTKSRVRHFQRYASRPVGVLRLLKCHWPGFLGCYLVLVSIYGSQVALNSILPSYTLGITKGYSFPYVWVGIVSASYSLTELFAGVFLGSLSDSVGRFPILAYTPVLNALSFILVAFSPNVYGIIIGRMMGGLFCGSNPASQAYVSDISSKEEGGTVMGIMLSSIPVAVISGAAVTAIFHPWLGTRYFVLFLVFLCAYAACSSRLTRSLSAALITCPHIQAILLIIPYFYVSILLITKKRTSSSKIEQIEEKISISPGETAGRSKKGSKISGQLKSSWRKMRRSVLKRSPFFLLTNCLLYMFVYFTPSVVLPLLVYDKFGLDPAVYSSIGFLLGGVVSIPSSFILVPLSQKILGTWWSLVIFYFLNALAIAFIPILQLYWLVIVAILFWFFVEPVTVTLQVTIIVDRTEEDCKGITTGVLATMHALGKSLSLLLLPIAYDLDPSFLCVFIIPSITAVIILFQVIALDVSSLKKNIQSARDKLKYFLRIFSSHDEEDIKSFVVIPPIL